MFCDSGIPRTFYGGKIRSVVCCFQTYGALGFTEKWSAINLYFDITGESTGQKTGKSHLCAVGWHALLTDLQAMSKIAYRYYHNFKGDKYR